MAESAGGRQSGELGLGIAAKEPPGWPACAVLRARAHRQPPPWTSTLILALTAVSMAALILFANYGGPVEGSWFGPVVVGGTMLGGLFAIVTALRTWPAAPSVAWLTIALMLLAGARIHSASWPTTAGSHQTPTAVLGLASVAALAVGMTIERQWLAVKRAATVATVRGGHSALAALAAHEIGSAVAAIRHLAETLADPRLPQKERDRALKAIQRESVWLNARVVDLQTVGALEQGVLSVQPFPVDLSVLLAEAASHTRAIAAGREVRWPQAVPARVVADPERIVQVLRNLIGNAVKYTPDDSPIELQVSRGERTVRIAVIDHGPGVHPDDAGVVFEMFGRGRRRAPEIAGSGLGLYLARELVRAHGGELRLESTPGGGATFAFELRVERRAWAGDGRRQGGRQQRGNNGKSDSEFKPPDPGPARRRPHGVPAGIGHPPAPRSRSDGGR